MKSPSRSTAIPDPTPFLFLMAATLTWGLFAADETTRLVLVGLALLAPGVWLLCRLATNAAAGVVLLVGAVAISRSFVEIGGLRARPEHIAVGLLCLTLPFLLRRRSQPLPWILADYLLAVYVGLNVFSSLFMSIAPAKTLAWSMQQVLAIMPYFFLRILAGDPDGFRRAFRIFLWAGVLEGAIGILCFYSNLLLNTQFGIEPGQYGAIPGIFGTVLEANILGAYCGATCVILLALYLQQPRRLLLVGFGITLAGMAISLSRAALGGTLFGFAVLAVYAWRTKLLNRRVLWAVAVAVMWVGIITLPALIPRYVERFSTLEASDITADPNTAFRVVQAASAIDGIMKSPVFGNGTASFQLEFSGEQIGAAFGWISNSELRILHDTGVVGLGVFLLFLGTLARRSWKLLRREARPALLALLVSTVVYCVTFQLTEGTLMAFTWIHLGLLACALCLPPSLSNDPERNVPEAGTNSAISDPIS
jgi:O-antigen ligase